MARLITRLSPSMLSPALLFILLVPMAGARADDELESMQGLVAEYRDGAGNRARRIDRDLSFEWGPSSPHPLIGAKQFSVHWQGVFLQREQVPVTFHAYLSGKLRVTIGDEVVLEGESGEAGWTSGSALILSPGFHDVDVRYEKTSSNARVSLFWSSEAFPLEPVSAFLFSHDQDVSELEELERGRMLYDVHRCNRCHVRPGEKPSDPAPALWGVTQGLNPEWLIAKLTGSNREASQAKMPQFGLNDADATAIAAFLAHMGAPHGLSRVPEAKKRSKDKLPTGRELLVSIGCLACHSVGDLGIPREYGGGDLSAIGAKRSPEWLATWLAQPDKLNPQHRMPVFKLTPTERSLLVQELSQLGKKGNERYGLELGKFTTAQVDRGRELVKSLRCANCHKIPAIEADVRGIPALDQPIGDWTNSCLDEAADLEHGRPAYSQADRLALRRYVESRIGKALHPLSEFDRGRMVLESRNCLGCHERDGASGIVRTAGRVAGRVDEFRGLSEALIPPNLTAVGDKLHDSSLALAVAGEQKEPRLPWLKVRMPHFQHSDEERAALTSMLIAHDRIPDGAPAQLKLLANEANDETLLLGRRLVGVGGFTCIACHKIGEYEPRNVAFGTRGSDLMIVGARMRPEFFLRWTRSPLRIVPGMEMPSYLRPVPGVLDEDLQKQFSTLWAAISHPDFEPPTNPTQVEQFLVVEPGEPPRIVRDVFTLPEGSGGGAVARALAVGFDNGHALLFDADTATVRVWTYGDFARQRTEGKSWYWDMAGTLLIGQPAALGEIMLRNIGTGELQSLEPTEEDRLAKLASYEVGSSSNRRDEVQLAYHMLFQRDGKNHQMEVREAWSGITPDSTSGWRREIQVLNAPKGMEPVLVCDAGIDAPFHAQLRSLLSPDLHFNSDGGDRETLRFRSQGDDWVTAVAYECDLPAYAPATPAAVTVPGTAAQPQTSIANPLLDRPVTTLPGYVGRRLDVPTSTMPTAMAYAENGDLYFTSLKGHVYRLRDSDNDGIEEELTVFEEGLAAPFGVLPEGDAILVAHKPELLRLRDTDGDGRCDRREVVADGWGYTDNYHDWTTGPVRDAAGRLYLALGSDYSQPDRPLDHARWRGKVLRVNSDGTVDPIAHELRFPQGIALDNQGRLFVTDQQGHGNPFNELDYVIEGRRYGVPARLDEPHGGATTRPAIQVPHPWTRSVNGLFFLPPDHDSPFAGHGIGCEYNGRFLVRYTVQDVKGELQGAVYPFSQTSWEDDSETFVGPIGGTVAPNGDILVGSIHDSGWLGGLNTGEVVRLSRMPGEFPNGIREVRAVPWPGENAAAFEIEFIHPVDLRQALRKENYSILGYTRIWEGSYATEDSGRYSPQIVSVQLSEDGRTATLACRDLKPTFVYEIHCGQIGGELQPVLFPDFAAYTLNQLP